MFSKARAPHRIEDIGCIGALELQGGSGRERRDHAINHTGFNEAYDVTITWASKARYLATTAGADAPTPDPPGGLTAFRVVETLLGNKIESQKQLRGVLVIDQITRKPIEN